MSQAADSGAPAAGPGDAAASVSPVPDARARAEARRRKILAGGARRLQTITGPTNEGVCVHASGFYRCRGAADVRVP